MYKIVSKVNRCNTCNPRSGGSWSCVKEEEAPMLLCPGAFNSGFQDSLKSYSLIIVHFLSLQDATVLTMTQFLVLLVDVNVKVRSGLTMTALKQGKIF